MGRPGLSSRRKGSTAKTQAQRIEKRLKRREMKCLYELASATGRAARRMVATLKRCEKQQATLAV